MIALPVADFLAADPAALVRHLAYQDAQRFRQSEAQQLRAWNASLALLHHALAGWEDARDWRLVLEFPLRRLGRRMDAVLATPRAILVLEFKIGATALLAADLMQVEDYALDLQDFHSGSRALPIVPILIATDAPPPNPVWPLPLAGASPVLAASAASLPALLRALWQRLPDARADISRWEQAPYHPVPNIVDAARTLYAHHGVADISAARADATNLTTTTAAILHAIAASRRDARHAILFVTGIPGAGKTLCGLNATFGAGKDAGATFLTGNPTLVHVLREALARDAAGGAPGALRAARQRTKSAIQALPAFRDTYVATGAAPPERVIVIDEAQRAWSRQHAMRKGRDREVKLTQSEPGHLLDIMGAHADWAVIVCLIGNGQEIHDGEGGLAEWGAALAARPRWQVLAAPATLTDPTPRQRLPRLPDLAEIPALHLDVPVRSLRNPAASDWVDALLRGQPDRAAEIARTRGPLPFRLTRSLDAMRAHLRASARGARRAGLVGSSGARRLRADGLGAELPHMDANAVAAWFLKRWPDVRASDALEVLATEFSCQGLELDYVGLCWGGDLIPQGRAGWQPRAFSGTTWHAVHKAEAIANQINTYRVLLTRARYETVIWVPAGNPDDPTRMPALLDSIADRLATCGVRLLEAAASPAQVEARLLI